MRSPSLNSDWHRMMREVFLGKGKKEKKAPEWFKELSLIAMIPLWETALMATRTVEATKELAKEFPKALKFSLSSDPRQRAVGQKFLTKDLAEVFLGQALGSLGEGVSKATPKGIIAYPGKKARQAEGLVKKLEPIKGVYREPFLGSGAVFRRLFEHKKIAGKAVLAERTSGLRNIFRSIARNPEKVKIQANETIAKIMELPKDKRYKALLEVLEESRSHRSGAVKAGLDVALGQFSRDYRFRPTDIPRFSVDKRIPLLTKKGLEERIDSLSRALNETEARIYPDWKQAVKGTGKKDFLFLDPPYHQTTGYKVAKEPFSTKAFAEQLKNLVEQTPGLRGVVYNSPAGAKYLDFLKMIRTGYLGGKEKIGAFGGVDVGPVLRSGPWFPDVRPESQKFLGKLLKGRYDELEMPKLRRGFKPLAIAGDLGEKETRLGQGQLSLRRLGVPEPLVKSWIREAESIPENAYRDLRGLKAVVAPKNRSSIARYFPLEKRIEQNVENIFVQPTLAHELTHHWQNIADNKLSLDNIMLKRKARQYDFGEVSPEDAFYDLYSPKELQARAMQLLFGRYKAYKAMEGLVPKVTPEEWAFMYQHTRKPVVKYADILEAEDWGDLHKLTMDLLDRQAIQTNRINLERYPGKLPWEE